MDDAAAAADADAVEAISGGIPALLNSAERTETKNVTPSTLGMVDNAPLLGEVRDTINSLLSSDLVVVAAALDVVQILCRTDETRVMVKAEGGLSHLTAVLVQQGSTGSHAAQVVEVLELAMRVVEGLVGEMVAEVGDAKE